MKYFPKVSPIIIGATNQLIKNKESKILDEMIKLRLLKKVKNQFYKQ